MNYKPSISDEAVLQATGRSWREWFGILDRPEIRELSHKDIVAFLREKHGVPAWWQQCITNEFEQGSGRREKHQTANGFQISVSRTLDLPAERLYAAWAEDSERARWLRKKDFAPSTLTAPRTVRGKWTRDGSRLDVSVEPIEQTRCRLVLHHRKLADSETAESMRKFWKTAIDRLVAKMS